jgi:hypothetical protein
VKFITLLPWPPFTHWQPSAKPAASLLSQK